MDVELRDEDWQAFARMFVALRHAGEWWNALHFGGFARCLRQSAGVSGGFLRHLLASSAPRASGDLLPA